MAPPIPPRRHLRKAPLHLRRFLHLRLQGGIDLISDTLSFGRLWYEGPEAIGNAVNYAKFFSRSHDAVIRVYDDAGNVIETHEHKGDFKEW